MNGSAGTQMAREERPTRRKEDQGFDTSPKNILALLVIASMIVTFITTGYSTYVKADTAAKAIEVLQKDTVKRDEFKDLTDDVKEIRKYIMEHPKERDRRDH